MARICEIIPSLNDLLIDMVGIYIERNVFCCEAIHILRDNDAVKVARLKSRLCLIILTRRRHLREKLE